MISKQLNWQRMGDGRYYAQGWEGEIWLRNASVLGLRAMRTAFGLMPEHEIAQRVMSQADRLIAERLH